MSNKTVTIRRMARVELDTAIDWARDEGWNPGLHDADIFWQTDPEGFVALEQDGRLIGCGSIVSYGGAFGFMGLFIVAPQMRGQKLGTALWFERVELLKARLHDGAAIGMDGVFAMQNFYSKGGFVFGHRDLRMEGTGKQFDFDNSRVSQVVAQDFDDLLALDRQCFGFDRATFLRQWITSPDSKTLKYANERTIAFGTIRKCAKGWKIGPLFAETVDAAHQVFRALNTVAASDAIYLDIPEINLEALKLAEEYEMKECFGCARMYLGAPPDLPYDKIFGVTTFELG